MDKKNIFDTLVVVKRSGQRTEFNGEKIALAIKKAFDSVDSDYKREDVNKIYHNVLKNLEVKYQDRKTIKIEDIQDSIEEQLMKQHFSDVYDSFRNYREQRALSRETFVIKQQHKFLKAIENLGLNEISLQDNTKPSIIMENSSADVLNTFGVTISKEFTKAYLLDNKYVRAHDSGMIHIDHIEYIPMGTTSSMQLDLERILKSGIYKDNLLSNESLDVFDYMQQAYFIIRANHFDQYGTQSVEAIDHYMAPGVVHTFQRCFMARLIEFMDCQGFLGFINVDKLQHEIERLDTTLFDMDDFSYIYKDSFALQRGFEKCYYYALEETEVLTNKAICNLVENLNMFATKSNLKEFATSFSFGTDTSFEGHMVSKTILDVLATHKNLTYPVSFFKVKKGINMDPTDCNYDLLVLASKIIAQTSLLHFTFLDTEYNHTFYEMGDFQSEVSYTIDGERVFDDITTNDIHASGGKGSLATVLINLPHIALKYRMDEGNKKNQLKLFYQELEETVNLASDSLLERFEMQCSKHCYNFPFLIEKGIWLDGEKVKPNDRLRKVLKHGTLSIGFVGLEEAIYALQQVHMGENKEAFKLATDIVNFMRKLVDAYSFKNNLNFVLSGMENIYAEKRFMNIDKAIYGKVKGVTDKNQYTTGYHFHVKKVDEDTIREEALFHKLTNGGHMFTLSLAHNELNDSNRVLDYIDLLSKAQVGCAWIIEKE